jgi:hypothetical protein
MYSVCIVFAFVLIIISTLNKLYNVINKKRDKGRIWRTKFLKTYDKLRHGIKGDRYWRSVSVLPPL